MTRLKYKTTENNVLVGPRVFCTAEFYVPNIVSTEISTAWIIVNLKNEVVGYGITHNLDSAKREVRSFLEGQGAKFANEIRVHSTSDDDID